MTLKEELEYILKEELDSLLKLEKIAEEKTEVIIKNDVNKLQLMIKEEENLINKVGTLEVNREGLLDSWGLDFKAPISDVIEKLPEGREDLQKIKEELERVLADLKVKNEMNNSLLIENLSWIDFNINLMTDANTPAGYGSDATDNEKSKNSIFDRKV